MSVIDHKKLYRFPWSLTDNANAWLEITNKCNLHCDGCYRRDSSLSMSLDEIENNLDEMASHRTFDSVSLAGGDPLLHPDISQIVNLISEKGWKIRIYTNGMTLDENLLRELESAGLNCLVFHIDSKQKRPDWEGKTEVELNDLRLHYARMTASVGGIMCAFNMTVHSDTIDYIPELLKWGHKHINIVHGLNFICFRFPDTDNFDFFVGDQNVSNDLPYGESKDKRPVFLETEDIVSKILESYPDFQPGAYLNGTAKPDSLKWLFACRFGTRDRIYGYLGRRFMELQQIFHHLLYGRYFSLHKKGGARLFNLIKPLFLFDTDYIKMNLRRFLDVKTFRKKTHYQEIVILQPTDFLDDGRQNMCDGCPDIMLWDGKLVWSCRLEECLMFGQIAHTSKKHS